MENNHNDLNVEEVIQKEKREFNYPLFFELALYILILLVLYSLFFGDSSIGVLEDAKDLEAKSTQEYNAIEQENQKLQKKHFELIQLTPQEDSF